MVVEVEVAGGPDASWVAQRLKAQPGITWEQLSDLWLEQTGHDVPAKALYDMARNAGVAPSRRPTYHHVIPWTVKTAHNGAYLLNLLRWLARRMEGHALPDNIERKLNTRLRKVAEAGDVSIHYEPESPDGFYLVNREPGDIEVGEGVFIVPPQER